MVKWQVSKSYCPSNEMRKSGDLLIDFQNKNTQKKRRRKKCKKAQWLLKTQESSKVFTLKQDHYLLHY